MHRTAHRVPGRRGLYVSTGFIGLSLARPGHVGSRTVTLFCAVRAVNSPVWTQRHIGYGAIELLVAVRARLCAFRPLGTSSGSPGAPSGQRSSALPCTRSVQQGRLPR
jgi:hypothetical protein